MDPSEIDGRGEMTTATIFEQVREISADLFQVPAAQITAESSPETLERWDSVQHLNLVLQLEQQFNVPFEPEEMDRMKNIGAVVDLVASKLNAKGSARRP
jgi:acyl carrier protein